MADISFANLYQIIPIKLLAVSYTPTSKLHNYSTSNVAMITKKRPTGNDHLKPSANNEN